MNGKVLKISSNDLYGNVDDRKLSVFAAFNHLKYMNRYVIFAFTDEFNKNELCYGSLHLKNDSIVVFNTDEANLQYIDPFIEEYLSGNVNQKEYEIIDISKIEKVELVSYNTKEYDKLTELDNISIKKEAVVTTEEPKKKKGFLWFLLIIMIALLIGVTYIYFNPTALDVELKELTCTIEEYNDEVEMSYIKSKNIKFNKKDNFKGINTTETYKFPDDETYLEFKHGGEENIFFNMKGEYKYDDDNLELKIFYEEESIIDNYEEIKKYLEKDGYTCQEGTYYE